MKTIIKLSTGLALIAAFCMNTAWAQNNVDITLHTADNGDLEVKVVPNSDFDGVFSALVFSLRWEENTGASLGTPFQGTLEQGYMPVLRSGIVNEESGYLVQIYAGFGMVPMAQMGADWQAGQEYTIATIPVTGAAKFELITSGWVARKEVNGEYYISLGGQDKTGDIIEKSAIAGVAGTNIIANIVPNPNRGQFNLSLEIDGTQDITLEVYNELGSLVSSEQLLGASGALVQEFNISELSMGAYQLRIRTADSVINKTILYQ